MRRFLLNFAAITILIMTLVAVFAITVSAEENSIVVRYCNMNGSEKEKIEPNANGTYTLRDKKFSGDGTVTMPDGTSIAKTFFGWFDKQGNIYEPGQTVAFTTDTDLFEAYGISVSNAEELAVAPGNYVRLTDDITMTNYIHSDWRTTIFDLNGHNITITHKQYALYSKRASCMVIGEGKITHAPEKLDTSNNASFFTYERHGYGDMDSPQILILGKDVTVETPYTLVRVTHSPNIDTLPRLFISGTATAKSLIRAGILTNATIKIYPSANLTFTGDKIFDFYDKTSTSIYANVTIDGTIKLENSEARLLDDFIMSNVFQLSPMSGGSYAFSEKDAETLELLLPDTLMLKIEVDGDGTTWYKVKAADCVHSWQRVDEESTAATLTETGIDVLLCNKCGVKKQKIALYTPANTYVVITVLENGQRKQYTVLGGEVYEFSFVGNGVNAKCTITALKDTIAFSKAQIVGIEIPEGIMLLESFENESIEKIKIADSSFKIEVGNLGLFKSLKTLEIGACEILFMNLTGNTTTLEGIYSEVPGAVITFGDNAFLNATTLKTLKMSAGSTYKFGKNSFKETGLTEVIFPDDSTIQFVGEATFYGSPNIKFVYFGRNCISNKKITNKPFDCVYAIETLVLMDIEYIDQYVFCCNGNANSTESYREGKDGYMEPIRVYHHGNKIEFNGNAFYGRTVNGVEFYTLSEITSIPSCKYTIIQGLGHKYYEGAITESTCLVQGTYGYATNCPCGIDYRENSYTVIDELGSSAYKAYGTDFVYLPLSDIHVVGTELVDVTYENYFENGAKNYLCAICANANVAEEVPSVEPLFIDLGYSISEDDEAGAMSYTVRINSDALEYMREFKSVSYGVIAGVYLNGMPITSNGRETTGNIKLEMKNTHRQVSVKLGNIGDATKDYNFNMAVFVVENKDYSTVRYAYENQTSSTTRKISYNGIKAELEKVPEPPVEEIPEEEIIE